MIIELSNTTDPVAQKSYKCIWCGNEIIKGAKHKKHTYLHDGDFRGDRFHTGCWDAMQREDAETGGWIHNEGFDRWIRDKGKTYDETFYNETCT